MGRPRPDSLLPFPQQHPCSKCLATHMPCHPPCLQAIAAGHAAAVAALVAGGLDPNSRLPDSGLSLLEAAAHHGRGEVITALIRGAGEGCCLGEGCGGKGGFRTVCLRRRRATAKRGNICANLGANWRPRLRLQVHRKSSSSLLQRALHRPLLHLLLLLQAAQKWTPQMPRVEAQTSLPNASLINLPQGARTWMPQMARATARCTSWCSRGRTAKCW